MKDEDWASIEFFKAQEFKCNCGTCDSTGNEMNYELVKSLDAMRRFTRNRIIISSGFRCLNYQQALNPGVLGAHPLGRASDIIFKTQDEFLMLCRSISVHNDTLSNTKLFRINGIGIYINQSFIHIDNMSSDEIGFYPNKEEKIFSRPALWGS